MAHPPTALKRLETIASAAFRFAAARAAAVALLWAAGFTASAAPSAPAPVASPASAANEAEDDLPARCSGPVCHKVATPVPWPEVRLDDGTTPFRVHGSFTIRLPKGPLEFLLHGDNGFTARYTERRWIGVQVVQPPLTDLRRRHEMLEARPEAIGYHDLPRILYTKTPADPEPIEREDRELWRTGLVFKRSEFENATQLQVAERGPLVAYFADAGAAGATGDIQVVHRRIKDSYLFVQLMGFSFEDVRRIVGSIESTRD